MILVQNLYGIIYLINKVLSCSMQMVEICYKKYFNIRKKEDNLKSNIFGMSLSKSQED